MANQKDLIIKIQSQYQNAGMNELKSALKQVVLEMDNLRKSGQQGSQAWNDLKTKSSVLTTSIQGLSREFRGLDANVKMSKYSMLEYGENLTVVIYGFKNAISGIKSTAKEFLDASVKMQSATMGLESIAKFKGIDSKAAVETLNNLDLVKNGLLSLSDASLALKNLLASGFSLEQSIELIKRFGDSASFGRQSALSFGQAITSATEGIKNQNSILVDNAGVTKNLSVIMKEGGMTMNDLSDATKKEAALLVLYNGLLKETQGQLGDAEKLTRTYAGQQAKLDAQILQTKQNFGIFLQQGLTPVLDTITKMPPALQATAYGLTTVGSKVLELVPALAITAQAFKNMGIAAFASFTGIASMVGSISIAIINLGVHLDNALSAFKALKAIWNGEIMDFARKSWMGKNIYGLDQTNTEENAKTETGFYEGIKNNIKQVSNLQNKVKDIYKNKKDEGGTTDKSKGGNELKEVKVVLSMLDEEIKKRNEIQKLIEINKNDVGALVELNTDLEKSNERILFLQTGWVKNTGKLADNFKQIAKDIAVIANKTGNKPSATKTGIFETADERNNHSQGGGANTTTEGLFTASEEAVNRIGDVFKGIASTLGIAADSFIGKLISGFDTVVSLIQTVLSTIQAYQTASSFLKILLPFFASGGYVSGAGTGRSDSIMARLSNGEYVVNANSTKQFLPLLEAINGNTTLKNIRRYADGGYVNRNINNNSVYIGSNVDGLQFFKMNEPKFRKYKNYTRI